MKKITKLEITAIIILVICLGLYLSPYFSGKMDKKRAAKVNANAAVFTTKALANFAYEKDKKASSIAKKTADELNTLDKNPFNKKLPAYVFENPQTGSVLVESDDKIQTITLTGLGENKIILVRTVIKPPSFVTYRKYEDKND